LPISKSSAVCPAEQGHQADNQIDLDTIDLSNLNRQFLFRKPDISKSKALVAATTARHFNPSSGIEIHARHGNVKEGANDVEWIKGFGLVMNALDNMGKLNAICEIRVQLIVDARRHVNKLCQAAGVSLIESGTAGYMGQATPIVKVSFRNPPKSVQADKAGPNGMFRLSDQTCAKVFPGLHDPSNSKRANTLYHLGESVSLWVSFLTRVVRRQLIITASFLARMTRRVILASWTKPRQKERMVS
jgi:molybdopterin/thiamine biosynthesis adenylyltransferase